MEAIKNIWKDRYTYAHYIAVVATIFNGVGLIALKLAEKSDWWMLLGGLTLVIGLALTLCAYCLGGLWTAIKEALNIAKWGWLVVPFPYDLATGPVAFLFAMIVLFLFPIVPVHKALKEYEFQQYIAQNHR